MYLKGKNKTWGKLTEHPCFTILSQKVGGPLLPYLGQLSIFYNGTELWLMHFHCMAHVAKNFGSVLDNVQCGGGTFSVGYLANSFHQTSVNFWSFLMWLRTSQNIIFIYYFSFHLSFISVFTLFIFIEKIHRIKFISFNVIKCCNFLIIFLLFSSITYK